MKRGLILEGGAMKGSYQIGAFYALKECKIKFDGFAGTSIGSFNAAMLTVGKERELLDFWSDLDPGTFLGADKKLIDAVNSEKDDIKNLLLGSFTSMKSWISNKGIPTDIILNKVAELLNEEELRKSKKDFGLVTVRLKGFKPLYITKEDIKEGELVDYILASCYLPIFKMEKIIDDNIYLDGGFYDNCPVSIFLDQDYDEVYAIRANSIGIRQRLTKKENEKVIYITPSRNICKMMEMNRNVLKENIQLGYYDTLKVLDKYDGYKYTFKKQSEFYYERLLRNVSVRELNRIKLFFRTKDNKEAIIKAVEYISEKKYYDYYEVYNIYSLIRKIKKEGYKDHFVYNFIKKLKNHIF